METYHKIQTCFKRDPASNRIIETDFTTAEFEYLAGNDWQWSEKVDGTNIRIGYSGAGLPVEIGGRTDNAVMPGRLAIRLADLFCSAAGYARVVETFGETPKYPVVMFGEGYGAGIQKGGGYREDVDFILFDIHIGDYWLDRESCEGIAAKLGIDIVPIIGHGTLRESIELVRAGFTSPKWPNVKSEGLVVRPSVDIKNRWGGRIITKIKTCDFSVAA